MKDKEDLSKSLEETKKSLMRSNAVVMELFERLVVSILLLQK